MMTSETEEDLRKQKKSIEVFVNTFGGSYKKLDVSDVDYKVFDKDGNLIAYAEISSRPRTLRDAYPLPIAARKVIKLIDKRITPVVIWHCDDGIIYGTADKLVGLAVFDKDEMQLIYEKQSKLKYIRFV